MKNWWNRPKKQEPLITPSGKVIYEYFDASRVYQWDELPEYIKQWILKDDDEGIFKVTDEYMDTKFNFDDSPETTMDGELVNPYADEVENHVFTDEQFNENLDSPCGCPACDTSYILNLKPSISLSDENVEKLVALDRKALMDKFDAEYRESDRIANEALMESWNERHPKVIRKPLWQRVRDFFRNSPV